MDHLPAPRSAGIAQSEARSRERRPGPFPHDTRAQKNSARTILVRSHPLYPLSYGRAFPRSTERKRRVTNDASIEHRVGHLHWKIGTGDMERVSLADMDGDAALVADGHTSPSTGRSTS